MCGLPLELAPSIVYEFQTYLSQKDPNNANYGDDYHFGRIDNLIQARCNAIFQITSWLGLKAEYTYRQNIDNIAPEYNSFVSQEGGAGIVLNYR
jgi:hypothetical protein